MSKKVQTATFKTEHESTNGKAKIVRTTEFSLDGKQLIMKGFIKEYVKDEETGYHELPTMRLSDFQQLLNLQYLIDELMTKGT